MKTIVDLISMKILPISRVTKLTIVGGVNKYELNSCAVDFANNIAILYEL